MAIHRSNSPAFESLQVRVNFQDLKVERYSFQNGDFLSISLFRYTGKFGLVLSGREPGSFKLEDGPKIKPITNLNSLAKGYKCQTLSAKLQNLQGILRANLPDTLKFSEELLTYFLSF